MTPLTTTVTAEKLASRRRSLWAPLATALVLLGLGVWRWQVAHVPAPAKPSAADSARPAATAPPVTPPDTSRLAVVPPAPPPVEHQEPSAGERPSKKLPDTPRSASPTNVPSPPGTEEARGEVKPPATPIPENPGAGAPGQSAAPAPPAPDREAVLVAIEPRRREVADARAAAEQDSAQATGSYRTAQGYEDSLLGFVAAADAGGANRTADRALVFYGRARAERAAILAQRSAAAERARAVAEPSHQRSGVARGDSQRKTAEAALASGDFAAARAAFEAAREEYERAGRKSR